MSQQSISPIASIILSQLEPLGLEIACGRKELIEAIERAAWLLAKDRKRLYAAVDKMQRDHFMSELARMLRCVDLEATAPPLVVSQADYEWINSWGNKRG